MSEYLKSRRSEEGDVHFCRFTFGQFFALLVLEVFTIFFVFYMGAKYGRDLLGLDRVSHVLEIEATESPKVLTTSDPEGAMAARELMAGAKTPELKDRIRDMLEGAVEKKSPQKPEVIIKNTAEDVAPPVELPEEIPYAENASVAAAPAQTPQLDVREENKGTETASSSASVIRVKSAEGSRYSVQIGSYPTMQEATATVEKWKTKGYPAYMMIADIPDRGRWYRVRMGGFQARSDATHYMKELKNRENLEAIVVLNEQ